MKEIKTFIFLFGLYIQFSAWYRKVMVIFAHKMNIFNFPFIYVVFPFEKNIFENGGNSRGADILSHLTVMLVISELNR